MHLTMFPKAKPLGLTSKKPSVSNLKKKCIIKYELHTLFGVDIQEIVLKSEIRLHEYHRNKDGICFKRYLECQS